MKNYISATREAWMLMVDDWMKIGGQLYRIKRIDKSFVTSADLTLTLQPGFGDPEARLLLITPRSATFKVYNQ
jgi:hypothetical protein